MTPNRRLAAVLGGCSAAISSSVAVFHGRHPSDSGDFAWGAVVGVFIGIAIVAAIKFKKQTR